jgi:hypothetical protein
VPNLVNRWGSDGYEPSGGPQRPSLLGMLPAWLVELILGTGMAPPAPPPLPRRGIPGVNGGMLPMRRPYQDNSLPSRDFPPRG